MIQSGLMEILSNCTTSNWRKVGQGIEQEVGDTMNLIMWLQELRDSVHGLLGNLAEHEA